MFNWRTYYTRYTRADPLTRLMVFAAVVFVTIVLLPRVPGVGSGVDCINLPKPEITGNNQSVLASQADPATLTLELIPERNAILQGEQLVLNVRFNNSSIAPLTLSIQPQESVLRYTGQEVGLVFSVQRIDGQVLGEPFTTRPPFPIRQQYEADDLRVLGPRNRCNVRVVMDATRLSAAGIGQGQYRITAVYRNQFRGTLPAVGALTPTPIFQNQGVWVGEIRSNEVLISVGLPTQIPPTAPQ